MSQFILSTNNFINNHQSSSPMLPPENRTDKKVMKKIVSRALEESHKMQSQTVSRRFQVKSDCKLDSLFLNKVPFSDLPQSFQLELIDDISIDLPIAKALFLKISQLAQEIPSSLQLKNIADLLKLIPASHYFDFKGLCSENSCSIPEKLEAFVKSIEKTLEEIEKAKQHSNIGVLNRIENILLDFKGMANNETLPPYFDVSVANIINRPETGIEESASERFAMLQKKINIVCNYFGFIFDNFLKANEAFEDFGEMYNDWAKTGKMFQSIKKYLVQKKKKEVNILVITNVLNYLWDKFYNFKKLSLLYTRNPSLMLGTKEHPIANYLSASTWGSSLADMAKKNSVLLLHQNFEFVSASLMDVRQDCLKIFKSYVTINDLVLSNDNVNNFIYKLESLLEKINAHNVSFEKITLITPEKWTNGNEFFKYINTAFKRLVKNYEEYQRVPDSTKITQFFMDCQWLKYYIGKGFTDNIMASLKLIDNERSQIETLKNKSKRQLAFKKLEIRLKNVSEFKEILQNSYLTVEHIIDSFEVSLLSKKVKEELSIQIEEKQEAPVDPLISIVEEAPQEVEECIQELEPHGCDDSFKEKIDQLNSYLTQNKKKSNLNVTAFELIQEVVNAGFQYLRQKGSHIQFKKSGVVRTIPFHNPKSVLSPGVVKNVRDGISQVSSEASTGKQKKAEPSKKNKTNKRK